MLFKLCQFVKKHHPRTALRPAQAGIGCFTSEWLNEPQVRNANSLLNTIILNSLDRTGSDLTLTGDKIVSNGDLDTITYFAPSGFQTFHQHSFAEAMIKAVLEAEQVHPDAENWARENMVVDGHSVILTEKGIRYNLDVKVEKTGRMLTYKGEQQEEHITTVSIRSIEEYIEDYWDDMYFEEPVIADYRGLDEYDANWHKSRTWEVFRYLTEEDEGMFPGEMAIPCPGHMAETGDTIVLSECHLNPAVEGAYPITYVDGDWIHFDIPVSDISEIGFPNAVILYRNKAKNIDWRPSVYDGEGFLETAA